MFERIRRRTKTSLHRFNRVFTKTRELARNVAEVRHFKSRLQIGRQLASAASLTMSRHDGYLYFDSAAFGSTDALVRLGRTIYQRSQSEADGVPRADKDYFRNIMRPEDLAANPAILDFALNRELLSTLSRYFGFVPELCSVGLMLSRPSGERLGSQHGHFDSQDSHHVKVIVAVEDVAPENGPFEFLPANASMKLRERYRLVHGFGGRFDDDALFEIMPREQFVKMTTKSGGGMIVDTSNCLHFGSRVEQGSRLLWFLHFATFADYQRMQATGNGAILLMHQPNRAAFVRDDASRLALAVRSP